MNPIPLDQCAPGVVYELHSRNLLVGVYNHETKGFIGIRQKFDSRYLFTEYHYETGSPFGTARPVRILGDLPDDMPLWERYPQNTCQRCGERVVTEGEEPPYTRRHVYTELGPPIPCDENPSGYAGHDYAPLFHELDSYEEDLIQERWEQGGRQEYLDEVRQWAEVEHLTDEQILDLYDRFDLSSWGLSQIINRVGNTHE